MEFFENTGLIGWGVILGLWIGHKLNKALVRRFNARLRRALRRNVVVDTINIDGNHSITRVSINGIDVLKIFAEAEGRLKIKVIRGDGNTIVPEILPPVVN